LDQRFEAWSTRLLAHRLEQRLIDTALMLFAVDGQSADQAASEAAAGSETRGSVGIRPAGDQVLRTRQMPKVEAGAAGGSLADFEESRAVTVTYDTMYELFARQWVSTRVKGHQVVSVTLRRGYRAASVWWMR
jgi:hypothetical protein